MTKIIMSLIFLFSICPFELVAKDLLRLSAHPEFPPIMYSNNKGLEGVGPELARKLLTEEKINFEEIHDLPWPRVQQDARDGIIDLIAGIYKNPEREEYLVFGKIPFVLNPSVAFARKESNFKISRWDDLKGKTGGALLGDKYSATFEKYLESNASTIHLERAATIEQNFAKLINKRIDYIIYSQYVGQIKIQELKLGDKIQIVSNPLFYGEFYFAFSKKSSFKYLLPILDKKIRTLKNDGAIARMLQNHLKKTSTNPSAKEIH